MSTTQINIDFNVNRFEVFAASVEDAEGFLLGKFHTSREIAADSIVAQYAGVPTVYSAIAARMIREGK